MPPEVELRDKLAAVGRRLRWLTIEERVSWCLLPGLVAALGLLAAHKLDRLDEPYPLMGLAVGVSAALGLAWGLSRRVSLLDAACLADRRLGLKERMSNAVLFAGRPEASPLVPALVADAARHAEGLLPATLLPYRPSSPARWSLFAAALTAAAWFAPTFALGRTPGEVAVRQEMREQGRRLREVAQKAREQAQGKQLQKPEELARKLEQLARELEKAKLSKKQALLKSGKLAAELREAQKLAALQSGADGIGRVAEALRNEGFETPAMQDLARAAREHRADEMATKIAKLAQEVRQGKLKSPAERAKLAEDVSRMAEAAEAGGMGELAEALREAASALKQGKDGAAAEAMERAAKAANEAAQGAAENQTLEQMAQELEQSQQEVAQADQQQCSQHGNSCPNPQPGGG